MPKKNNKDKSEEIDESVLDETPPNINEPQQPDPEDPDNIDPNPDPEKEEKEDEEEVVEEDEVIEEEEDKEEEIVDDKKEEKETPEQKEKRYKAQQSEAQIQAARNRALSDRVDEASKLPEPTVDELKAFVKEDGIDWEDLTAFEQATARRTYLAEKRFSLVNEAVQTNKKIDEWAGKLDEFIDSTDGKPEFVKLSGHEADFRKFAMKESHRGVEIGSLLLPAFLNSLPAPVKKRGALFETAGGGEKVENTTKIVDADAAANLRATNPREWKRQIRLGNIRVEA